VKFEPTRSTTRYEVRFPIGTLHVDMMPGKIEFTLTTLTGTLRHELTGEQAKDFATRLGTSARRAFVWAYKQIQKK